ncbi:cytochrome P450 2K1 [Austrofundulus limnaeus]|uniref:Cytochrome P450 2K1 n=1 Tax=Austrofundulus limnaeus TaxID=52670 RepID=A0A2I4BCQ3_AUSLI|nr:PREDICTED: cytochrome P450 2K1-like [Austrofundulus limnaeus]
MFEDLQSPYLVSLFGVFVALLLFHLLYSSFSSSRRPEPPGPRPVPLFGNLFQVDLKWLDKSLFALSKKYGPVFQVHFGPKKVVVLAGYKAVKQALVDQSVEFGNRDITPAFYDLAKSHGIIFSNGDSWKEMRRFALKTLRDFGMGKKLSEEIITKECCFLIDEFEHFEGKPFSDTKAINCATSNVISVLLFGRRFDYKDPVFQAMVQRESEIIRLTGSASVWIYNIFPWLAPLLKNWRDLIKNVNENIADASKIIADLKDSLDPEACKCYVDAFLSHKKHLEDSGLKNLYYHDENLLYSVTNLLEAGNDTTANTVKWGLFHMVKNPHIQDGVLEELSRVVGSRQIRLEDRKNLPYTDAVIHEIHRLSNIFPLSLPHATSTDVTFQGYFIEKGTTVFPLLTSVLYDESEWESPYTFNPSHFLDNDGNFVRRDALLSFSAGRRACLGEILAKAEVFIFFTSLLQRFRFTPPPGVSKDELDLTPAVGFSLCPRPQNLCAVRRK